MKHFSKREAAVKYCKMINTYGTQRGYMVVVDGPENDFVVMGHKAAYEEGFSYTIVF